MPTPSMYGTTMSKPKTKYSKRFKEIALLRGRDPSGFEVVLFSDQGEAFSKKVEEECCKYGVKRETTTGYTPQHNAFAERWFRTNAEMSRCQMLQYDTDERYWEDSRRMASFIYNRVPPVRKVPGEDCLTPMKRQYPERTSMDMTKLRPFGLICYVYQKKAIRNKGYHGKSDKKENAKKGVLVGYEDQLGPLRVKVYHPQDNTYQWVDEDLVTYADPLLSLNRSSRGTVAVHPDEMEVEYFEPLIGTRHKDPDNGLIYETTEIKIDHQGYIVAYRRVVTKGLLTGRPDGPFHVADIASYTDIDLDRLSAVLNEGKVTTPATVTDSDGGRTEADQSLGDFNTSEVITSSESTGRDKPRDSRRDTSAEETARGNLRKRKRQVPTTAQEQVTDGPRRSERLSGGSKSSSLRHAHMTTALAAAVSAGDMFTTLAVDQIHKEQTTRPREEHMLRDDFEPPNREYMQKCAYKDKWIAGEQEELKSIAKHEVWMKKAPPPGTKILPLKWIYRVKRNRMGEVVRWKCRLVAQGFFQVFGEDYDQTYSPVAKFTSIRTVLAISAQLGLTVRQMDVDTVFLNAPIHEDIWVRMPKGTPLADDDDGIYKLKKSLYGLKQAPREWNNHINGFLKERGFQRMEADSCIYIRPEWDDAAQCNKYSIVALYVDDLIIACSNIQMCKNLEKEFGKQYHMKVLGEIKHILGMDVEIDPVTHVVHMSQAEYIKKSVKDYGKYGPNGALKLYSTPMDSRQPFFKGQSPEAGSEEALRMQSRPYRELIGTLLWIANGTRPDISYAVGTLAKYTNNPAELHWHALLRVLGYLAKTVDYCIRYEGVENGKSGVEAIGYSRGILPQVSDFKCYVDASFAADLDTRRSTTGYIFKIAGGPVSWQSRMQTSVALSNVESEYMAASAAAQEAIWLNRLLEEMGFKSKKPITLYEDNKAAILFSDHPGDHRRSKHIDTRKYFLRDAVTNGEIKLEYINTTEQLADGLTKALTPDHHLQSLRSLLSSYQLSKAI